MSDLGLKHQDVFRQIQIVQGVESPVELPPPEEWRLHLKHTTLLDISAVRSLSTARTETKDFFEKAMRYLDAKHFYNLYTSRTIKPTSLSDPDIQRAVEMNKFEPCDGAAFHGATLPLHAHGVNVFTVPELKGRRRLITEPHLNAVIAKHELPRVHYPTRLERRQSLRYAKYMLQIDFEAYYDSIPIPPELRDNFVFRSRKNKYYRLKTLPTGARWSVAVGQGITNVIVDIDTPVIIHTLIDNILIAAVDGQEKEFLRTVRAVLRRIREVNLMTSPDRDELLLCEDDVLLKTSLDANVFLGEEYAKWNGTERLIRNSAKTVAKLQLSLLATKFSHRSFASVISLVLFALHTTQINPASAFKLMRAYRGVYRQTARGYDWDDPLNYLDSTVHQSLLTLGHELAENKWWTIADERMASYDDKDYDFIVYTDASASGWGAIAQSTHTGTVTTYQQQWVHDLYPATKVVLTKGLHFNKKHSAHAEPRGAHIALQQLVKEGLPNGSKVAIVTDHFPIAHAQKRLNGYGGIGRGYALNKLYEYSYDLLYHRKIQVVFFYLAGRCNPADNLSRNFGECTSSKEILVKRVNDMGLPPLSHTRSPLCDEAETGDFQPAKARILN